MKFTSTVEAMLDSVNALAVLAGDAVNGLILANLHLLADAERLTITAYDGATWGRCVFPIHIETEGCCLLNADKLKRWLSASPKGNLTLAVEDKQVLLKAGSGKIHLPLQSVEAYPMPCRFSTQVANVSLLAKDFLLGMIRAEVGVDKSVDPRFETGLFLLNINERKLTVVGPGRSGMSLAALDASIGHGQAEEMIPAKSLRQLRSMFQSLDEEVTVSISPAEVVFQTQWREMGTRAREGRKAPWQKWIADSSKEMNGLAGALPEGFYRAVKQAVAVDHPDRRLELTFLPGQVKIDSPGTASTTAVLPNSPLETSFAISHDLLTGFLGLAVGCKLEPMLTVGAKKTVIRLTIGDDWTYFCALLK